MNFIQKMDKNSIVIITGANSGMGKATSTALAGTGAKVIMMCRSRERGEEALREVIAESKNDSVELMLCDLASLDSIRSFCHEFKSKYSQLHVLVNNAGVTLPGYHLTKDGFELQFGVNHLGHFLLTMELLDLLKKSAPSPVRLKACRGQGRIVNVSSGAHKIGKMYFDDINLEKSFKFWRAYARSKLANILFTNELAERLEGTNVTVNSVHPGAVATNMGINRETGFGKGITRLLKPFFQTPTRGAETAIYLAMSDEVKGVSGKYFVKKKPAKTSKLAMDRELAKKLWKVSEEMVGYT